MGYIVKKTYSTYDSNNPNDNVLSSEKISFIQPNKLSQITNANGDTLNLTSKVNHAYTQPSDRIVSSKEFKVKYMGDEYTINLRYANNALSLEDDYGGTTGYKVDTLDAASGLTKNQAVSMTLRTTGNGVSNVLKIQVKGPGTYRREHIMKHFSINFDMRDTYIDYGSRQSNDAYWNWWAKAPGDASNNRRTIITEVRKAPGSYNLTDRFAYRFVGTHANCAVQATTSMNAAFETLTMDLNLLVNVNNVSGEQGLIGGVYNWDIKFNSEDILDKEA